MTTYEVRSFGALVALLKKHAKRREGQVRKAARRAAVAGRAHLKRHVPVAHGEIRESVHVEDTKLVVDAPHAAAVNNGSRPHWPPLAPLIAWVKLRGTQGLLSKGRRTKKGRFASSLDRLPGTSTKAAALGVAGMIRAHVRGGATAIDAPEQVARAIQRAIAARGTRPHHFIEKALPDLYAVLGAELRKAIAEGP